MKTRFSILALTSAALAALLLGSCDSGTTEISEPESIADSELSEPAPPAPGDAIIAKLEEIIIPVVDFEDVSVEEAIDYLRV
ncbi:MAG: hypothetical protein ACPG4K_08845, partial [Haloferula sp.]